MLKLVSYLGNASFTLNIYGQYAYIPGLSYTPSWTWDNAIVYIPSRFDPVGGGDFTNNVIIVTGPFPNAHFVQTNFNTWSGNTVKAGAYFALSHGTPTGTYNFKDIALRSGQHLVSYGKNTTGVYLLITNASSGDTYTISNTTGGRYYDVRLFQRVTQRVVDSSFNAIQGATVYLRGNAGETETDTTDSNGDATIDFQYHTNLVRNGNQTRTSRVTNNELSKYVFAYGYQVSSEEVISTQRSTDYDAQTSLVADNYYTLTKTVADALTSISTLDELYDRAKSWKIDNLALEVPTIADLLFTANGTELLLHNNWNLVLDNTATEVFDVDSTSKTITIKAASLNEGTKLKTLKAQGTGTITAANSELINVGYIDADGDSFIDFISALEPTDTWKAFSVEANRDGNTSEVGTGNGTQNYRFNFTAATTIYLRIIRASTGAIIPINLSVPTSGSQAISFDPSIIAAQTNALVGQINNTIKYLPSEVFVDAASSQTGVGSHKEPYNMIGDAVTFANANNVDAIVLLSNITLNAALMSHDVRSSKAGVEVVFGGQNIANSQFINLHLEGVATGSFESDKCHIHDVTGLEGNHYNGCYGGTNVVNGTCHIFDSSAKSDNTTFDLTGKTNVDLEIHSMTGQVTITGSTSSTNKIRIASKGCSVILAASNTAGIFTIDTAASLEDNSIGVTLIMNNILGASTLARTTNTDAIQTLTAEARDHALDAANNTQTN